MSLPLAASIQGVISMSIRRLPVASLTVVVLVGAAAPAWAQNGPINGNGNANQNGSLPTVNAEMVAALLKRQGHQAEIRQNDQQQGKTVAATIKKDGWQYEVSIRFTTATKRLWFSTVLRPAEGLTAVQLQTLLKKTWEQGCSDVFVIDGGGRLCLETPNFQVAAYPPFDLEQVFLQKLNRHLNTIRNSYDLWKMPTIES
jgi:hypothetical protein